jgi:hypothetical protein
MAKVVGMRNLYHFGHQVKVNNTFFLKNQYDYSAYTHSQIAAFLDIKYKFYRGNRINCDKRNDTSCKMGFQQYLSEKKYAAEVDFDYAMMQFDGNFVVYVCFLF